MKRCGSLLILSNRLDVASGGADICCATLCSNLKKRGWEFTVASSGGSLVPGLEKEGIEHSRVNLDTKVPLEVLEASAELSRLMTDRPPGLIHCDSVVVSIMARLAVRRTGGNIPVLTTIHNLEHSFYYPFAGRLLNLTSQKVITVCDFERHRLVRHGLDGGKAVTIHTGIDLAPYDKAAGQRQSVRTELGIKSDATVIGTVGRLSAEKAQERLLQSAGKLSTRFKDLHFMIAGGGDREEYLRNMSRKLGLGSTVTFTGQRADIPRCLSAMDIFVLCSKREAFPVVILEAMASSLPVVSTDVGGVRELVEDSRTGLLAASGESDVLARATSSLIEDAGRRKSFGKAGRKKVEESFSLAGQIDATEKIYDELLEVKR